MSVKTFDELSLGIREIFRIVVPGGYTLLLLFWLAPSSAASAGLEKASTLAQIAVAVLIGLAAYGLQVHEKWFPYSLIFKDTRARLNEEIKKVAASADPTDHVHEYKYLTQVRSNYRGPLL
jgi:hypothetical protein